MKKVSVIIIILATILIVTGVIINLTSPKPTQPIEEKDPAVEEDPSTKSIKLDEITTENQNITLKSTTAYYSADSQTSGVTLYILSTKSYEELFLTVTFNIGEIKEERIIYITDIKANIETSYIIQSTKDYSKITSWSVKEITKNEAIAAGLNLE